MRGLEGGGRDVALGVSGPFRNCGGTYFRAAFEGGTGHRQGLGAPP